MILTDRFVFLHLHKSGGSFVNRGIHRHVPGARQVGYHLPSSLIPAAARSLPVIGLVRNPWSYYVSWYCFQQQKPRPNALFRILSEEGRLDFNATIHRLLDLGSDEALLSRVVDQLPRDYGSQGLNLPGFALAPLRGRPLGFYTYLYTYMYGPGGGAAHIGRMEALPAGLLEALAAAGCPVDAGLRDYLQQGEPVNTSRHGPYAGYYEPALRDRVATLDALVIGRHGYVFGT